MGRNFFSRVETCFPIEDEESRRAIFEEGLEPYLRDNARVWLLRPDGSYEQAEATKGDERFCAQEWLLEHLGAA